RSWRRFADGRGGASCYLHSLGQRLHWHDQLCLLGSTRGRNLHGESSEPRRSCFPTGLSHRHCLPPPPQPPSAFKPLAPPPPCIFGLALRIGLSHRVCLVYLLLAPTRDVRSPCTPCPCRVHLARRRLWWRK